MKKSLARGRVFPQYYSTDRRYGRISLMACALFPLMWVNADDQGRLLGDPEEVKYTACPNIDHIGKADVPGLLQELHNNGLISLYTTPKGPVIQLLDWWEANDKMQWAWPSEYPPAEGWRDRLRYKKGAIEVRVVNWRGQTGSFVGGVFTPSSPEGSPEDSPESVEAAGKSRESSPPAPPVLGKNKKEEVRVRRRGRGSSPEASGEGSGEKTTTSTSALDETAVMEELTRCYRTEWGAVHSKELNKVIPRALGPKDRAQLRDLARELAAGGVCPDETIREAFREAALLGPEKMHISYVRAIILDWLGRPRERREPAAAAPGYQTGPCPAPDPAAKASWELVLAHLRLEVSKPNFRTWFEGTVGISQRDGVFLVGVPSAFVAEYLDKNQRSIVEKALVNVTKTPVRLSVHILAGGGT